MKYISFLFMILHVSCNSETSLTDFQKKEFEKMARTFQNKYNEGGVNSDVILNSINESIKMSESLFGEPDMNIPYEKLVQYCPHLPQKEVIKTITEQRLLDPNLGYDYVSQLYLRKSVGDTARETSSRIWAKEKGKWKIIQMNNAINKACD